MVVADRDVAGLDLARLDAVHARLCAREPHWAHRLDLAYVSRSTLASFRSGGSVLSLSHDDPLELTHDADSWLQTWYLVRAADSPIVGPPAADVIPPIAPAEFVRAVAFDADRVVGLTLTDERAGPLTYTILTLCRVLVALETSMIVSKQEAAEAIARERPAWRWLLEACLRVRREHGRIPLGADEHLAAPVLIAELAAAVRERRAGR